MCLCFCLRFCFAGGTFDAARRKLAFKTYAPHLWLSGGPTTGRWFCPAIASFYYPLCFPCCPCGCCHGGRGVGSLFCNQSCCLTYYWTFNEDFTHGIIQPSLYCCPRPSIGLLSIFF